MYSRILLAALVVSVSGLSACSLKSWVSPYRIDVRQGNLVSPEMVAQLKTGMTRDQVKFVLGTPLIVDPFRSDRWDYPYLFAPGRGESEQRRLTVIFRDGLLAEVRGDIEAADSARITPPARVIEIPGPAGSGAR